jgi:hypothetical protein
MEQDYNDRSPYDRIGHEVSSLVTIINMGDLLFLSMDQIESVRTSLDLGRLINQFHIPSFTDTGSSIDYFFPIRETY